MPSIPKKPQTEDSKTFDPDRYFDAWGKEEIQPPYDNDFRKFMIKTFGLPIRDNYGYMAQHAEVTLLHAQTQVEWGGQGGLHNWYKDAEGNVVSIVDSATHSRILIRSTVILRQVNRREIRPTPPTSPRTPTSSAPRPARRKRSPLWAPMRRKTRSARMSPVTSKPITTLPLRRRNSS